MTPPTLRQALAEWTDFDGAGLGLALCLGLMDPPVDFASTTKHVFWSNNPIGNLLYGMLEQLAAAGVLEKRDEPDYQFRWSPTFKGSWEEPWQAPAGGRDAEKERPCL